MKITALLVLKSTGDGSESVFLANASDVSHFGYFQRHSVREFIVFVGRTVANRTPQGQRQSVQHEEYKVHAYNRNGLCAVGFMDDHYPVRSAFSLLNQVTVIRRASFCYLSADCLITSISFFGYLFCWCWMNIKKVLANLGEAFRKTVLRHGPIWMKLSRNSRHDPAEADKLLKIQRELDETKIILHKTIDSVLARGEKLDSLVEKSSDLSAASQVSNTAPVLQLSLWDCPMNAYVVMYI
ncbi:hypothetical protein TSUD_186050 [Trifolium subterraneum]|uniref:Longin domain-containing protein n=2 Tax=Trifolium TaxID=3898 RepID=A0A2Z6NZH3_TRISU|nr:hypothetical protein TSUD_186050 [Trifolium subterraneum]